jgi:hypothetical protein
MDNTLTSKGNINVRNDINKASTKLNNNITEVKTELKIDIQSLNTQLIVIKWMPGIVIAVEFLLIFALFFCGNNYTFS